MPKIDNGHFNAKYLVRRELHAIGLQVEAADKKVRAATEVERKATEAAREEVLRDFWAAEADIADLLLLMLRYGVSHRAEAIRTLIVDLLKPELDPLANSLAKVLAKKGRR